MVTYLTPWPTTGNCTGRLQSFHNHGQPLTFYCHAVMVPLKVDVGKLAFSNEFGRVSCNVSIRHVFSLVNHW